jgi:hypothetical protein
MSQGFMRIEVMTTLGTWYFRWRMDRALRSDGKSLSSTPVRTLRGFNLGKGQWTQVRMLTRLRTSLV